MLNPHCLLCLVSLPIWFDNQRITLIRESLKKIQQWYAWYCWAVDHILSVSQVRDDDMKSRGQLIRLNFFSPAQIAQLTTCNLTNTKSLKLVKFQRSLLDVVQLFGHLAVGLNNSLIDSMCNQVLQFPLFHRSRKNSLHVLIGWDNWLCTPPESRARSAGCCQE